jgi:hypothetical protein
VGDVTVPISGSLRSGAAPVRLVHQLTTKLIVNRDIRRSTMRIRRAMMLGLDHQGFIDIISEAKRRSPVPAVAEG